MYLRGLPQIEIAAALGISQATCSSDLAKARERWRDQAAAAIGQVLFEQLAKLDEAEAQAWVGWERSCRDAIKVQTKTGGGREKTRERQAGNPAFLRVICEIVERRCKLLDLEPIKRISLGIDRESIQDRLAGIAQRLGLPAPQPNEQR